MQIWQIPPQDVMGGNWKYDDLDAAVKGIYHEPLQKFMDYACLMTAGFEKAQYGWTRNELKKALLSHFKGNNNNDDNSNDNDDDTDDDNENDECVLYKGAEYGKDVNVMNKKRLKLKFNEQKLQPRWLQAKWAQIRNTTFFHKTHTIEWRKLVTDKTNNATPIFSAFKIKPDDWMAPVKQQKSKGKSKPKSKQQQNKFEQLNAQICRKLDPSVPKNDLFGKYILECINIIDYDNVTPEHAVYKFEELLERHYSNFTITKWDQNLLWNGQAHGDHVVYPSRVKKLPAHSNWDFIDFDPNTLQNPPTETEVKEKALLLETAAWIIGLYVVAKFDTYFSAEVTGKDLRHSCMQIVSDLQVIYKHWDTLSKINRDLVNERMGENNMLAYAMTQIKWMIYLNKVYTSFVEKHRWRDRIANEFPVLSLKSQCQVLKKITEFGDNGNEYITFLIKQGLQWLFVDPFFKKIAIWQNNKRYREQMTKVWCLNDDWKTQYQTMDEIYKKEEEEEEKAKLAKIEKQKKYKQQRLEKNKTGKGKSTGKGKGKAKGKGKGKSNGKRKLENGNDDEEEDTDTDEPATKRRKIVVYKSDIQSFVDELFPGAESEHIKLKILQGLPQWLTRYFGEDNTETTGTTATATKTAGDPFAVFDNDTGKDNSNSNDNNQAEDIGILNIDRDVDVQISEAPPKQIESKSENKSSKNEKKEKNDDDSDDSDDTDTILQQSQSNDNVSNDNSKSQSAKEIKKKAQENIAVDSENDGSDTDMTGDNKKQQSPESTPNIDSDTNNVNADNDNAQNSNDKNDKSDKSAKSNSADGVLN